MNVDRNEVPPSSLATSIQGIYRVFGMPGYSSR